MITIQDILFQHHNTTPLIHAFIEGHADHYEATVITASKLERNLRTLTRPHRNFDKATDAFEWIVDEVQRFLHERDEHINVATNTPITPFISKESQRDILYQRGINIPVI